MLREDMQPGMYFKMGQYRYLIVDRDTNFLFCRCWNTAVNKRKCLYRKSLLRFTLEGNREKQGDPYYPTVISKLEFLMDTGELGGKTNEIA